MLKRSGPNFWLLATAAVGLAVILVSQQSPLVARLQFTPNASQLDQVVLRGTETWTPLGRLEPSETEVSRVTFFHAFPIALTQTMNGKPLDGSESARQYKQNQAAEAKILKANLAPDQIGQLLNLGGEIWTLAHFEAQFDWTQLSPNSSGNVRLSFTPRPNLHPRSRIQRILGITAGTFDVDPATGQILGGEFHSIAPLNYAAGLLAHIAAFDGSFRMQQISGCWVTHSIVVHVTGRELFHRINGTESMQYVLWPPNAAARPLH